MCLTQGLGYPVLAPGPAWSRFVLGLASPLPVARSVLVAFLVKEELRGVQQNHPLFLLLPKPLPGVPAMGLSQSTQLGTVLPSFILLTLSALITSLLPY